MTLQSVHSTQLSQVLIAFGGAILGGLFVLAGGWIQGERDQKQRTREMSQSASKRILMSLAELEGAIVEGVALKQLDGIRSSFNNFSLITTSEAPFITDNELISRIRNHIELMYGLVSVAAQGAVFVADAARKHSGMVTESLEAHIRKDQLPPYKKPPLRNAVELLAWATEG